MIVLGIDASLTSSGLCLLNTDVPKLLAAKRETLLTSEPKKGVERLLYLRSILNRWLDEQSAWIGDGSRCTAVIEGYAFGAVGRLAQLGEWGGLVRVALAERGIAVTEMNVQHLKQFVTGQTQSKKEEMMVALLSRFGIEYRSNDAADAFALALSGALGLSTEQQGRQLWQNWMRRVPTKMELLASGKIKTAWQPSVPAFRAVSRRQKR